MSNFKMLTRAAFIAGITLLLGGCGASYQARSVEIKNAVLVNPDILKKGSESQALYRYVAPNVNIKAYSKIMIDPVIVKKDGTLSQEALADYQKLANNAHVFLKEEMGKDYQVVNSPEPGTMRVQMAIVDADSTSKVSNTLSTFVPVGMVLSWGKYAATGKQMGVGEVTIELRITDAATGELLAAALDRRVGGKDVSELWSSWYSVDEALKYWAKKLRFACCELRGDGAACVKPEPK